MPLFAVLMSALLTPAAAVQPARVGDVTVKRVLRLAEPLRHGDYAWDDAGVPPGRLVITADLDAETMSVFRGGYEIGTAAILYGAPDHPTPTGRFRITQKDADHVSSLYDAPMPYMMRLTDDGVAIHASNVAYGAASHGCVSVPAPFARWLFAQARVGDPVYITRGRMIADGDTIVDRYRPRGNIAAQAGKDRKRTLR